MRDQLITALELDKEGNWNAAHQIVQTLFSKEANRIHAYLHRKEGDLGNAGYWYSRAGQSAPSISLEDEWDIIFEAISKL